MRIQIYNELDDRECRICFENNESGNLISPCDCDGTQKYIHEECLQKWRDENRGLPPFLKCEICHKEYIIEREFEPEDWTIKYEQYLTGWGFLYYIFYLYLSGIPFWYIDHYAHYTSLDIISFGLYKNNVSIEDAVHKNSTNTLYYMSVSAATTSLFFFTFMLAKSFCMINRKALYWKHMFLPWIIHFILAENIFLSYFLFLFIKNAETYLFMLGCLGTVDIYFFIHYCKIHNQTIGKMNIMYNQEYVLSIERDNDLLRDIAISVPDAEESVLSDTPE